jgi:hypothetical protein
MRRRARSLVLPVSLIAVAILNLGVLDLIGRDLVADVFEKYDELGSSWIGVEHASRAGAKPKANATSLESDLSPLDGVRDTRSYWTIQNVVSGPRQSGPGGSMTFRFETQEVRILPEGEDALEDGSLFLLVRNEQEDTKFSRVPATLVQGRAPKAPGEILAEYDYALDNGLSLGSFVNMTFDPAPGFGEARKVSTANFTIVGFFDRGKSETFADETPIFLAAYDPRLVAQIERGQILTETKQIVLVESTLPKLAATVGRIRSALEAKGLTVATSDAVGGVIIALPGGSGTIEERSVEGSGTWNVGGPGFGAPDDVMLHANDEILGQALGAATKAGWWFRFLTVSAILLAMLGIGFVTASRERQIRREAALRQALGFSAVRLWSQWARASLALGLVGAATGLALVWILARTGLARPLLGVSIGSTLGPLVVTVPIVAVVACAIATLPTFRRVLRSTPADNLRLSRE